MPLFMLNPMWILFGQLLDKILLLFIPTSGHIDARVGFAGGRFDATLTISLNHTHTFLPSLILLLPHFLSSAENLFNSCEKKFSCFSCFRRFNICAKTGFFVLTKVQLFVKIKFRSIRKQQVVSCCCCCCCSCCGCCCCRRKRAHRVIKPFKTLYSGGRRGFGTD